ncbi:Uncharacterised protein [Bordetella pertussis]|nr:Uncharacterised protein [Bordetella pertussis]CFW34730.1 Uncharacterised protein [Bordetella pertussis]
MWVESGRSPISIDTSQVWKTRSACSGLARSR